LEKVKINKKILHECLVNELFYGRATNIFTEEIPRKNDFLPHFFQKGVILDNNDAR
jgi:hypothetical protein